MNMMMPKMTLEQLNATERAAPHARRRSAYLITLCPVDRLSSYEEVELIAVMM